MHVIQPGNPSLIHIVLEWSEGCDTLRLGCIYAEERVGHPNRSEARDQVHAGVWQEPALAEARHRNARKGSP